MTRLTKAELWSWYQKILEFEKSELTVQSYCAQHKLNFHRFRNLRNRILDQSKKRPQEYAKRVELGRNYLKSEITKEEFAKKNNISFSALGAITMHLHYVDMIEKFKNTNQKTQENDMKFIQVAPAKEILKKPEPVEAEIIPEKNDIEIMISKGVKVSISPNIDALKIIKIIELLKDL